MRYLLLFFPFLVWAVLPNSEMELFIKKYADTNLSSVVSYKFANKDYYVIHCVEERFFPDDSMDEEIPYLKACSKQLLLTYKKEQNPKIVSLQVSNLLHGKFWMNSMYFHHLAQVPSSKVKPIFSLKNNSEKKDKKSSSTKKITKLSSFTIEPNDVQLVLKKKITQLEAKSKQHPKNIKLLEALRSLYKQLGNTEGYASINERIMAVKMDI
jgi:hypothetical protein